jgi:N-acetylmuramoyl-L-alanine amidase
VYQGLGGLQFVALQAAKLIIAVLLILAGHGLGPAAAERAAPRAKAPDPYPVATDSRLGGDENQVRFVVDFSRKIDLRAFTLADPYRVVVDIPQVTFKLPARAGDTGRGLVKAYRFGLVMQGGSRIVLDLTRPVRIDKAFVLDAAEGQPARMVLDLVAIDRDTFMRALALDSRPPAALTAPRKFTPDPSTKGDPRPIIVLDPGHGGIDHGTRAGGGDITEKQIVLEFALLLRDQIEKTGKYRVVMTRTDDTFVPLNERVQLARQRNAALFISIHADSLRRSEGVAQGATVYTLSDNASDAEAARLAEAENRADVIAGIDLSHEPGDVADILIDLAQRETKSFSMHFAKTLVTEFKSVVRLHKQPLKSAGFKVLKAPDVPSVLVELGYVSNKEDLKQLTSGAWRSRTARSIVQAVDTFFSTRLAGAPAGPR